MVKRIWVMRNGLVFELSRAKAEVVLQSASQVAELNASKCVQSVVRNKLIIYSRSSA